MKQTITALALIFWTLTSMQLLIAQSPVAPNSEEAKSANKTSDPNRFPFYIHKPSSSSPSMELFLRPRTAWKFSPFINLVNVAPGTFFAAPRSRFYPNVRRIPPLVIHPFRGEMYK